MLQGQFINTATLLLNECIEFPLLRRWLAIGLGRLWANYDTAR